MARKPALVWLILGQSVFLVPGVKEELVAAGDRVLEGGVR